MVLVASRHNCFIYIYDPGASNSKLPTQQQGRPCAWRAILEKRSYEKTVTRTENLKKQTEVDNNSLL